MNSSNNLWPWPRVEEGELPVMMGKILDALWQVCFVVVARFNGLTVQK
ncbi:hypothetical protein EV13_0424 [Prochlorococcus sp. MIT 0702]|nr:hypothetical protein EV12_1627 [Prochlorococcus sp. MIT 0701]KGG30093.1 hypothetical protein EV13_0424 [Prochlorococcus sp. MIT 0702]KGG33250.1 hypothetical protein EV14_1721 [Prochlorococcus sp. MIT 0703]